MNYVGVSCETGEQEKEAFRKEGTRHPKLVYKTVRINALLPFIKGILRPKDRIR